MHHHWVPEIRNKPEPANRIDTYTRMLLLVDVHEHHLNKETRKSNSHGNVDEFYEVSNEPHDGKPDSDSPADLDEF